MASGFRRRNGLPLQQWDGRAKVVLEGLQRRSLSELCAEYQIHPTQYYKWRGESLDHAHEAFGTGRQGANAKRNLRVKTASSRGWWAS